MLCIRITQEPNGDEGSGCKERESVGFTRSRNGRVRLHVCVDWMVALSGSWAVMPGIAVRLFVNGASRVKKCPVAPVSRTTGDFYGEEA